VRAVSLIPALVAITIVAAFISLMIGEVSLPFGRIIGGLFGQGGRADILIMQEIRLPRTTAAFLTGGALGMSGAALQGLLRNPLAEPGVLGVSAAAIFGATLSIAFGLSAIPLALPAAATGGAGLATLLLALLAARLRSVGGLLLVGIGLSSFIGALMSLTLSFAPDVFTLAEIVTWSFGSVTNRSWQDVGFALPFIFAGTAVLAGARRGLSVLALGEEAASSLGLGLQRLRLNVVVGTGLATGGAVALAGGIGFVGIVAPHLIRPLTGHDTGRSLLPSFLFGGTLLILADIGVRLIPTGRELQLGVLAALIGAPVFIMIAARGRIMR
jgi:iron complex transport system permease protein